MKSRIITFNNVLLNLDEIVAIGVEGTTLKVTFKSNSIPLAINFKYSNEPVKIARAISSMLEAKDIGG